MIYSSACSSAAKLASPAAAGRFSAGRPALADAGRFWLGCGTACLQEHRQGESSKSQREQMNDVRITQLLSALI